MFFCACSVAQQMQKIKSKIYENLSKLFFISELFNASYGCTLLFFYVKNDQVSNDMHGLHLSQKGELYSVYLQMDLFHLL